MKLSSNLAALDVPAGTDPSNPKVVTLGFLTRGFVSDQLEAEVAKVANQLGAPWAATPDAAKVTKLSDFSPWLSSSDNWLVKLALKTNPRFTSTAVTAGGIETGPFVHNFPR